MEFKEIFILQHVFYLHRMEVKTTVTYVESREEIFPAVTICNLNSVEKGKLSDSVIEGAKDILALLGKNNNSAPFSNDPSNGEVSRQAISNLLY